MRTIETQKIEVVDIREAREVCACDVCKKVIFVRSKVDSPDLPKNQLSRSYWAASRWHNDWGTDSGESFTEYDICSPECLDKFMAEYRDASKVDDRNTKAVQIEHETVLCYDDGRTNA